MRRYWTPEEDRLLLAFSPYKGRSLRDLADEIGRTYYATRLRRKGLRSGVVTPAGDPVCELCRKPLPETRRHGYCSDCRKNRQISTYRLRYLTGSLSTTGVALRKWTRWTADEDRRVVAEGVTIGLARELGRTLKSCSVRRQRLLMEEKDGVVNA